MGVLNLEFIQNIFKFDQENYYFKKSKMAAKIWGKYAQIATFHI